MVLHMLRRLVGDDPFFWGMRRFYSECRFKKAGTDDFRRAMEATSGPRPRPFFDAWIHGAAIPRRRLQFDAHLDRGAIPVRTSRRRTIPAPVTVTDPDAMPGGSLDRRRSPGERRARRVETRGPDSRSPVRSSRRRRGLSRALRRRARSGRYRFARALLSLSEGVRRSAASSELWQSDQRVARRGEPSPREPGQRSLRQVDRGDALLAVALERLEHQDEARAAVIVEARQALTQAAPVDFLLPLSAARPSRGRRRSSPSRPP